MDPLDQDEEESFWKRHRFTIGGAVAVLIGMGLAVKAVSGAKPPVRVERQVVTVSLPPPPAPLPPPPPPPPPQAEPPKEKMVDQEPVSEPEPKPDDKPEPPKAPDEPPATLGTNVQGDGPPDGFGLSGGGSNFGGGAAPSGSGTGGRARSQWGWYAGMVQTRIADALRKNGKTRAADLQLKLRIWPDASGRIERVALVGSSGDPALDEAIRGDVLTGLRLSEPPPQDMPLPIVMRITARRPN